MQRQNEKLGISEGEVFVTESYLKKRQEEQEKLRKEKEEDVFDLEHSIANEKLPSTHFNRKLLEGNIKEGRPGQK